MGGVTLQFSTMSDIGSWAIREFSHGPFSHVDAVLPDGSLLGARDDICMGIPAGVRIRPPNYARFSLIKQVTIPCSDGQILKWLDWQHAQVGKPYDETAILAFAADRNWREEDSFFCSELQALALEQSGYFPHNLSAPANKITPDDLLLALSVVVAL